MPVQQDAALARVIEATEQLDQGRLPGAVAADDGYSFAGGDRKTDIMQSLPGSAWIAERHMIELDVTADRLRQRPRVLGARDSTWHSEQLEQVAQV